MNDSVHLRAAISAAERQLAAADSTLAGLIERYGPCTIYDRPSLIDHTAFHTLAWSIINQQLSVASARSIERKLLALHPRNTFQPGVIERLSDSRLRSCGLSRQKSRYLRDLCRFFREGHVQPRNIRSYDNQKIAHILSIIPGVGPWTIDMFLMFYLARLDVLPLGDLALRKAISICYNIPDHEDIQRMQALGERWAPYRTIASWYLWCSVD